MAALLRGHLLEALRQNALAVLLLPFAISAGLRAYVRAMRPEAFAWPSIRVSALAATVVAAAVFTIARNLPR